VDVGARLARGEVGADAIRALPGLVFAARCSSVIGVKMIVEALQHDDDERPVWSARSIAALADFSPPPFVATRHRTPPRPGSAIPLLPVEPAVLVAIVDRCDQSRVID